MMTTIVSPGPIIHAFAAYKEPSLEDIVRSLRSRGWSHERVKKLIKSYAHRTKTPLPWRQNVEHGDSQSDCAACEPKELVHVVTQSQGNRDKDIRKGSLKVTAKAIIGANRLLNAKPRIKKRCSNICETRLKKFGCTQKKCALNKTSTHRLKVACGRAQPNNKDKAITPKTDILKDYAFFADGKLGAGAHSLVYKVIHRKSGIKYACKCIKKQTLGLVATKGLLEEASLMHEISHPSIVRLWDLFEDRSMYFLVMDLVQGGELFERVVNLSKFTECEARDTTRILLDVLHYLHDDCAIAHRDLKPENIICCNNDINTDIKLCDFGYAAHLDPNNPTACLTRLCGTSSYLAPEVLLRIPYGSAVDMWGLGCVVFILLSGYAPFSDTDSNLLKMNIINGNYDFFEPHWTNVSDCGKDFVSRLLTTDPTMRFSAHDALHHPWISEDATVLENYDLTSCICHLRQFTTAQSKLKKVAHGIIAANRFAKGSVQYKKNKKN